MVYCLSLYHDLTHTPSTQNDVVKLAHELNEVKEASEESEV